MAAEQWSLIGLDHVQLAAPKGCEAAARHFFGELLGLEEVAKPAILAGRGGVWFALGAHGLHIGVEEPFRPAQKAHPALLVRDVAALAARLEAAGVQIIWDDQLPGYRRFYTFDPWGNRLECLTPQGG